MANQKVDNDKLINTIKDITSTPESKEGATIKQIAEKLGVTKDTIRKHVEAAAVAGLLSQNGSKKNGTGRSGRPSFLYLVK